MRAAAADQLNRTIICKLNQYKNIREWDVVDSDKWIRGAGSFVQESFVPFNRRMIGDMLLSK